jgi:hypothetical protein
MVVPGWFFKIICAGDRAVTDSFCFVIVLIVQFFHTVCACSAVQKVSFGARVLKNNINLLTPQHYFRSELFLQAANFNVGECDAQYAHRFFMVEPRCIEK